MKKLVSFLVVCLVLPLTACQQNNKSNPASSTATSKSMRTSSAATMAYSDLSAAQRDKVSFTFKPIYDIASGDGSGNTPAPFIIDVTIKNNAKQIVTFDKAKFLMFDELGKNPTVKSAQSGLLKLKPGETKKIHSLYQNVGSQVFLGTGAFYYLNTDYKLAYFYNAPKDKKGVTSDNLKTGEAKDFNEQQASSAKQVQSSSATPDNDQATTKSSDTATDDQRQVTADGSKVDVSNLTTQQVKDWVFLHVLPSYTTFHVTESDFFFETYFDDEGLLNIDVRENHNSPTMRAQGADPKVTPRMAAFKITQDGQLYDTIRNQVVATSYGQ
ncbi:hypothetical protein FC83_GL002603 [Agrilactobacillus composti DSM 18527 = JCM 14202]|uniref:DUF4352 domain-containing protein n=1 Tax=Agrilactobacillus composti DSM 18527 = JCM 14202 TaxID=1423734 RepID=X0PVR8_9LACO|nr:hypothetical protein [Agrilactobacillus composti]KRM36728.1 hypothetical protein FC83_GL002603 [Agrilactobacillus composti DSM 18527 = JCM 14202]GAF41591.1 hypothetical protein JCM14202_3541 [Agrilactobacillus composti DSM 18527 = JCM 14202]